MTAFGNDWTFHDIKQCLKSWKKHCTYADYFGIFPILHKVLYVLGTRFFILVCLALFWEVTQLSYMTNSNSSQSLHVV